MREYAGMSFCLCSNDENFVKNQGINEIFKNHNNAIFVLIYSLTWPNFGFLAQSQPKQIGKTCF